MVAATLPLSIFLQTVPATPLIKSDHVIALNEKVQPSSDVETASGDQFEVVPTPEASYNLPAPKDIVEDGMIGEVSYTRPEPATIQEALREAFTSPAFWLVCLGFSVCGFHVAFLGTHLPAYLVEWISLFYFIQAVQIYYYARFSYYTIAVYIGKSHYLRVLSSFSSRIIRLIMESIRLSQVRI